MNRPNPSLEGSRHLSAACHGKPRFPMQPAELPKPCRVRDKVSHVLKIEFIWGFLARRPFAQVAVSLRRLPMLDPFARATPRPAHRRIASSKAP